MKLVKLYCNKDFHNITFITQKGGLNVIIGDAKGEKQHNLGKSKFAELLDFMLLKDVDKMFFFWKEETSRQIFENKGYEFYLEILLNSGKYLTIMRSVDTKKISFKLNETISNGFNLYTNFDYSPNTLEKAKSYLNEQLNIDFCKQNNISYRKIISYSLRQQGDYDPKSETIFQLKKYSKNKDINWKPLIFSLLGFNGELLELKYKKEAEIKDEKRSISAQEKDFGITHEEKDLLIGKIQNATLDKEKLNQELETFNFYQQDKDIISNLVGSVELQISEFNSALYNLESEIEKLEKSIRNKFAFDLDKVQKLFDEVGLYFPEQLSKKYEDLLVFNSQITQERNTQIKVLLEEKKIKYKEVNVELKNLNKKREDYIDLIQDTTFFKKYNVYQNKVIELEKSLTKFQTQLEALEDIEKKKHDIEIIQKDELEEIKRKLKEILDNTANCEMYMKIRRTFSEIVNKILNDEALITILPNSNYNIDFKTKFSNSAKADGYTYYKVLCIAFDLAILINYRDQSHFRFVYHDDVISGDDNGVKNRLIETVKEIAEKYDIQYIFSSIKDNLPITADISNNIILELNDFDESGKLFKKSF